MSKDKNAKITVEDQIIAKYRALPIAAIIITPRQDGYAWQCFDQSGKEPTLEQSASAARDVYNHLKALS